jgi:hypothetical protein
MKSISRHAIIPLMVVVLIAAYFLKVPSVPKAITERGPWASGVVGRYVDKEVAVTQLPAPKASDVSAGIPTPMPKPTVLDVQKIPSTPAPATTPFDVRDFAMKRAQWPKTVALTKATEFPVVAKGKVLGYLEAAVGTEVKLLTISGGKLAVEYQGGGAWVFAEETDIASKTTHP